jgi:outer membrane protein OmpA-like peptidoglycan-associated protein
MKSIFRDRSGNLVLPLVVATLFHASSLIAQLPDTVKLENLGGSVNSRFDEVGPIISPDGKTLYLDRTDHPDNVGKDDIWVSTLQRDGTWSVAKNIGVPLNNADHNFVSAVTPDGNTLLLGNVYNPDGTMGPGVSMVYRMQRGWSAPRKLDIRNYYSLGLSANYTLANDGKTLLMAVERNDSYGDLDLFVSFLQPEGDWSEPVNLGPDINTPGADRTPFLAADGVTLYYASDGRGGYGSSDIFVARRLDSTWRRWSTPVNMGKPINTSGWDGFFTIPASGEYAYLVSSQNSFGGADIFRVRLREESKPRPVVLISGRVLDANTKQPLEAEINYTSDDGQNSGTARTDPATGEYKVTLPAGSSYSFRAMAVNYSDASDRIDLTKVDAYKEITRDFLLKPLQVGSTVRLSSVLFAIGSDELQSVSRPDLNRVIRLLSENPVMEIEIAGHTDNMGDDDKNLDLSQRRADAVKRYLVDNGIASARIVARGYGESTPTSTNDTAEGRRLNRRVEFTVTKQ